VETGDTPQKDDRLPMGSQHQTSIYLELKSDLRRFVWVNCQSSASPDSEQDAETGEKTVE